MHEFFLIQYTPDAEESSVKGLKEVARADALASDPHDEGHWDMANLTENHDLGSRFIICVSYGGLPEVSVVVCESSRFSLADLLSLAAHGV